MTAKQQLEKFIAKFDPAIAKTALACLRKMRNRLPGAIEIVYDNYNALAIGFGPSDRASEAIFSIALYPRWVTLFFLQGAKLKDPYDRLQGSGSKVRHVRLESAKALDDPEIVELMKIAMAKAKVALDAKGKRQLIIKAVVAKQRPRRAGK